MPEPTKTATSFFSGLVKFLKSPTHLYPLAFLLAYAVLFGLYDLRQVPRQRSAILDQSFRRLALASDQIRSRMENIEELMRAEAERVNTDDPRSVIFKNGERHLRPDNLPVIKNFYFLAECDEKTPAQDGISFQILPGNTPVVLAVLKNGSAHLCGESPLQPTIESATHGLVGTGFNDVAVITSSGRVIYQYQSSALRLATLGDLPSAVKASKSASSDDKASSGSGKETQSPLTGVSYSRVADLSFAERKYKLLLQPIVLPVSDVVSAPNAEQLPSLELVGIIDDSTLTAQARSLPYDWLINVTGGILLALVLTWPVLKIWKMGPAEGFRSRETLAFGLSLVAAAMLVTVLTYYNSQAFNYESIDANLDHLANSIDTNFKTEITTALQTLRKVSESAEVKDEIGKVLAANERDRFQAYPAVLVNKTFFSQQQTPAPYRWFDQIFWVDERGNQILKWSTQENPTGRTKVLDEAWFQNVLQGRFWTLDCVNSKPESFVLDSIYSPNTTAYFGMIAQVHNFGSRKIVATMVTPFVSVINPLLSPMDGFAILDEKGVVRFHSDPAKNLRETFLNEIRPSAEARSAIDARQSESMTANYNAKKYRVAVRPISFDSNEAWTLVVFHDLTLRQRFFLNTLVLTIIYTLAYVFALTGLTTVGVLLLRLVADWRKLPIKDDWLRPTTNERFILWGLVALFAILLVLFRFLTGPDHRQGQYLATVLSLPLIGLLASYFALRHPSATGPLYQAGAAAAALDSDAADAECASPQVAPSRICRFGVGSVLGFALTLLLTLVSIFPAAEFFEIAFNDSVVPNMEDLQIGIARNIIARNDRIYTYVREVPAQPGSELEPDRNFLRARLSETLDRYTLGGAPASTPAGAKLDCWLPNPTRDRWPQLQGSPGAGRLFRLTAIVLKNVLPFPEAVRKSAPLPGSWRWVEGNWANQQVLEMIPPHQDPQDPRKEDDAPIRPDWQAATASDFPIASVLHAFPHQNNCGLVVIGLVFSLFWFTRYTVLRRFGLDLRPASNPIPEVGLPDLAQDTTRNVLALEFPRSADAQALAALNRPASVQVFCLECLLADKDWKKNLLDARTELIVISGFEAGIVDPRKRMETLELLEEIVEDPKRKLLLISTTDPVYYLYTGRLRDLKKLNNGELKTYSRWLNVLNSFETRRVAPKPGKTFSQEEWHALWDTCSEREQLALWQLANYCVINPKNTDAVEHLYRRGILTYAEAPERFEIFRRGFKDFVTSELTGRQIEILTSYHKDTAWSGLKWVLIYTGMALPLFLAFTTADFWDLGLGKLMTFGSAGAAALQTISKIAEMAGAKFGKGDPTG